MKKIVTFMISIILCLSFSITPSAVGDPNMDGGGGSGLGDGTSNNIWGDGNGAADGCPGEGVRVSIINIETKAAVGDVVDFTNINWDVRKQNLTNIIKFDSIIIEVICACGMYSKDLLVGYFGT